MSSECSKCELDMRRVLADGFICKERKCPQRIGAKPAVKRMTPKEHPLTQICTDIGCSGIDPDMCKNRPNTCSIIRKILANAASRLKGRK